jgi:hypothetical protein
LGDDTPFAKWNRDDAANCNWNNKGLNVIFMTVYPNEFKRIFMRETNKEA